MGHAKANIALGLAYFGAASAAILLTRLDHGVALLWIANAPLLARLLRLPARQWGAPVAITMVASMAASALFGPLALVAPLLAIANIGEAIVGALLLKRWTHDGELFDSIAGVFVVALAAGLIAPIASAILGASVAAHWLQRDFAAIAVDWVTGHGLGTMIVLPLLTCLGASDDSVASRGSRGEVIALLALVAGVTAMTFGQSRFPVLFLPMLPILIVTFRLGRLGAGFAMILLALIGGYFTIRGLGPVSLLVASKALQLQFFQFYLGITFTIALPITGELERRRELTRALRDSETKYRFIVENTTDIVLDLAVDGTIRYASPSVRHLGGFDPDALTGRNAGDLIDPAYHAVVLGAHRNALVDPAQTFAVEYQASRGDGEQRWFETRMRAVIGPDGTVASVVSAVRDIHDRKHAELVLTHAASTDPLTGVANRRTFDARLDVLVRADTGSATLAMIDLDHFKAVNDMHGHDAGDRVLQSVAAIIRQHLRATDLVARVGGEEFAILFEATDIAAARAVCERVRHVLERQPIRANSGKPIFVTASIGLAAIEPGQSSADIARAADRALYEAKAAGRNCLKIAA